MKKTYDQAFKLNIAKQIMNKNTTITQVAVDYPISRTIISRWVLNTSLWKSINQSVAKEIDTLIKYFALKTKV